MISPPEVLADNSAASDCPYKGLLAFTESDADYFFGRDADRDLVIANLMASRLTVLYGPSGVGKSSLLQAGVMRHLRQIGADDFSFLAARNAVVIYHSSWRDDPSAEIGSSLRATLPPDLAGAPGVETNPALTVELLQVVADRLEADLYLLFDQFEEETLYQTGPAGEAFAAELGRIVATPNLPVSVLLGVREDALAKLDRLEAHVPGVFENVLRLDHLDRASAREAIERPLIRHNSLVPEADRIEIEPALVDELLTQLQTGFVTVVDVGQGGVDSGNESIETPFLQLVMTRLWAEEQRQGSRVLRVATLAALGGAERIVRTHLDAVMEKLTEEQRQTAAQVFRHLVTPSGTKIAMTAGDLADYAGVGDVASVRDVLERLAAGNERVLRPVPPPVGSDDPTRYEIFHDVMAPAVLDWRQRYATERDRIAGELALVKAKQDAEEQHRSTRRRLRRSRILSGALALVLIATLVLGLLLKVSADRAQQGELMAQYQEKLNSDPAASLRAALQAWHNRPTPAAEGAVRTAFNADTQRLAIPFDEAVATSEFSPDGASVLAAGNDGSAKLFDAADGRLLSTFVPTGAPLEPVTDASFSPDGRRIFTMTSNGQVRLYDAQTAEDLGVLARPAPLATAEWGTVDGRTAMLTSGAFEPATVWDVADRTKIASFGGKETYQASLSRDGRYVVTLSYSTAKARSSIQVWEARSGRNLTEPTPVGADAWFPVFATAGSDRVALVVADDPSYLGRLTFWDWRTPDSKPKPTGWSGNTVSNVEVSADGRLVAASFDNRIGVFDGRTGKEVGSVPEQFDLISTLAFSVNGTHVVAGLEDGRALVFGAERENKGPVAKLLGHRGSVRDVGFHPTDPRLITTASYDGTARTWEISGTVLTGTETSYWVHDADVSADGQYALTASSYGRVSVHLNKGANPWKLEKESLTNTFGTLNSADFTPDGSTIVATMSFDWAPATWAWETDDGFKELEKSNASLTRLDISDDGRRIAAGDAWNRVIIWDVESRKVVARLGTSDEGRNNSITDVAFVPGSDLVAASSTDGTTRLWRTDGSDQLERTLGDVDDVPLSALDVTFDGVHLVSASADRMVRVWRVDDGALVATIQAPAGRTTDVAFSPDGRLVALTAGDEVHVWQWADNQVVTVLRPHGLLINTVTFSERLNSLITSSDDSTAVLSPYPPRDFEKDVLPAAAARDRLRP
jgi:WD40 repeat protein